MSGHYCQVFVDEWNVNASDLPTIYNSMKQIVLSS